MSHMYVHGLLDRDPSNDAMAMNIRNSSNISVTESEFEDLHHAINFLDSDHVTVSGNSRSEEHTSELQSLMRISYAVFCLKKKKIDMLRFLLRLSIITK